MLNSNVHNPEIEKHQVISEEKFVATNAGVDEGKDIPRPILHEIYHSVINHEIVSIHEPDGIFEQDGTQVFLFSEPFAEGQLRKQGGINRVWANRYFRICESRLFYFKNDKDHIEKGPVHPFAHDVAEDRAGGADQRAGHDQRHVRQSEADTAGRPAGIAVQHGDYDGHVRAADRDND